MLAADRADDGSRPAGHHALALPPSRAAPGALLRCVPAAVVLLDERGFVLELSDRAVQLLATTREEALGWSFFELTGTGPADPGRDRIAAVATGEPWMGEVYARRRDGVPFVARVELAALRNEQGPAATGVIAVIENLTARRLSDDEQLADLARLRAALVAGEVGSWTWDAASDTLSWSSEVERIMGLAPGTFEGGLADATRFTHPDDLEGTARHMRESFEQNGRVRFENRIIRADGALRWLETRGVVLRDGAGAVTGAAGVCFDVTERRLVELERDALRDRLALLTDMTAALSRPDPLDSVLQELVGSLVPAYADAAIVDLPNSCNGARRAAVSASDERLAALFRRSGELQELRPAPRTPAAGRLARGEAMLLSPLGADAVRSLVDDDEIAGIYEQVGAGSSIVAPLIARGEVLGMLTLVRMPGVAPPYDADDLAFAVEIARRAGLAISNAQLFDSEHRIAETLQRRLLPQLPDLPGLRLADRFVAAGSPGQQVGGDWFDAFGLPDGAIGLAIGDVVGHDIAAATTMAALRSHLRASAFGRRSPADVLDRLDELVQHFNLADLATAAYLRLEYRAGDSWSLAYATAGHLPPLVLRPDGCVVVLDEARSVLLGAGSADGRATPRGDGRLRLPVGSTILLYTDGLVEVPGESLDDGLDRLVELLGRHDPADPPELLCDRLGALLEPAGGRDDTALLAVQLLDPTAGTKAAH